VPNQLSLVFTKGTVAVIALFFAASIAFFIYRHKHSSKFAQANEKGVGKKGRTAGAKQKRLWKFYFEDSVSLSGRYLYLDRPVDTVMEVDAVFEILKNSGKTSVGGKSMRH
jgi:hypothetical protein